MDDASERESLRCAGAFAGRWKAEIVLLGYLCPAPKFRWGTIGKALKIDVPDFTGDDTNLIARCLCVGYEHGRDICAKLVALEMKEAGMLDEKEDRDFITGGRWGHRQIAVLFTRTAYILDERDQIIVALGRVRRLPEIPAP